MDVTDPIFPSSSNSDVTDLDFSFTSCASNTSTDRTFTSSSARSSITLSFNESRLSLNSSSSFSQSQKPHRKSDPHWSAIRAATNLSPDATLHLRHLKLLRHLGTGNLGRVYLCRLKDFDGPNYLFALKVVDRDVLTTKKLSHVQMESDILSMLDHPFLPSLYAHLDVSHYTCLLIDYCPGGDLHSLLRRQPGNCFRVDTVRFFASEVLVTLEYLHAIGVVYRDLKPENVLIREDGHVMLSDFDLCFKADVEPKLEKRLSVGPTAKKRWRSSCFLVGFFRDREMTVTEEEEMKEFVAEPRGAYSRSCVGTHEYLAPELVNGNGHGNGVDWWAFGVFVYEMMYGRTPFKGESKESTLRNIASTRGFRFPAREMEEEEEGVAEAKDLIERLLVREEGNRLGCARGAAEIKQHPFFKVVKWPLIRMQRVPAEVVRGGCGGGGGLRRKTSHLARGLRRDSGGRSWGLKRGFGNLVKWSGDLCRTSSGGNNNIKGRKWV